MSSADGLALDTPRKGNNKFNIISFREGEGAWPCGLRIGCMASGEAGEQPGALSRSTATRKQTGSNALNSRLVCGSGLVHHICMAVEEQGQPAGQTWED